MTPLVLYHGKKRWTAKSELAELLDVTPRFARVLGEHTPRFRYWLTDLGAVPDEQLGAAPIIGLVLLLLEHVRDPRLLDRLPVWAAAQPDRLTASVSGLRVLSLVVEYLLECTEHRPEELASVLVEAMGPKAQEAFMTGAQILREEGRKQGRQEVLARLLRLRFGPVPEHVQGRMAGAGIDTLELWAERVLTAATLDEVFAE